MTYKTSIDDYEFTSEDGISSVVNLRENAINDCIVVANNEKGKNYLSNVHIGSEIVISYQWADAPVPLNEWIEVFRGKCDSLNPSLSIGGEIVSIHAVGKGICLKDTRVSNEYGLQSKNSNMIMSEIDAFYDVNGYSFESDPDLRFEKEGDSPWLFINEGLKDTDYIFAPCYKASSTLYEIGYNILGTAGSFSIEDTIQGDICTPNIDGVGQSIIVGLKYLASSWTGMVQCAIYKHSDLSLIGITEHRTLTLTSSPVFYTFSLASPKPNLVSGTAYVVVVWGEQKDGNAMVVFDNGSINETHTQNATFSVSNFPNPLVPIHNNYKLSIYLTVAVAAPYYADEYSWTFPEISTVYELAVTSCDLLLRGRLYDGTGGHCDQITIEADLYIDGHWVKVGDYMFISTDWTELTTDLCGRIKTIAQWNALKLRLKVSQMSFTGSGIDKGGIQISYATLDLEGKLYNAMATLRKILTDPDIGIIPRYVEQYIGEGGTLHPSGYSVNTDYVYDEPLLFNYLNFPYQSAFDSLKDIINLLSAMRYPNSGVHWIMTSDGKLLLAPIGFHQENGIPESIWNSRARATPLEVTKHNILEDFIQSEPEANYVLVAGNFEFPTGDIWCEEPALWMSLDIKPWYSIDCVRGRYSIKMGRSRDYAGQTWWIVDDMAIDLSKLATRNNPVTLKFWIKKYALEGLASTLQVKLYTGNVGNDKYFYQEIWSDVPTDSVWYPIELELGVNGGWNSHGTVDADWNSINHIGFTTIFGGLAYNPYLLIDGISLFGAVIRVAYNNDNITTYGKKEKTIRDSLALNIGFDPDDDSSKLAQIAKYELLRCQLASITGKIMIELDPRIKAGQLIHIHAGRTNNPEVFNINKDFRIVEVQHSFTIAGALTTLSLTDDLYNSIPVSPSNAYNDVIQCVDPEAQTKTMASLKAMKELDKDLIILAKDYGGT